jgi:hypothetical protein
LTTEATTEISSLGLRCSQYREVGGKRGQGRGQASGVRKRTGCGFSSAGRLGQAGSSMRESGWGRRAVTNGTPEAGGRTGDRW